MSAPAWGPVLAAFFSWRLCRRQGGTLISSRLSPVAVCDENVAPPDDGGVEAEGRPSEVLDFVHVGRQYLAERCTEQQIAARFEKIGRASCRERVCQYV